MGFLVPNEASATYTRQAGLDSGDLTILAAAHQGNGVLSGCAVTAQGSPDLTVAVASGQVQYGTATPTVAGGNLSVSAGHATLHRIDLVVVDNAGTKSVTPGTAADFPVFPAIPANSVVIAAIYVQATATVIATGNITDKRCFVSNLLVRAAQRYTTAVATALVAGDFSLSSGWGTTASVSAVSGNDHRGKFTVTSAGTGQSPNPTIEMSYKDGAWAAAPLAVVYRRGGDQMGVSLSWDEANTGNTKLVITFEGTPSAGESYQFGWHLIG